MAEAEDVIVDAARHATIYARDLWRRNREPQPVDIALVDVAERLSLLIAAVFARTTPLRVAQPPARPTMLTRLFRRNEQPASLESVPATDGVSIWLPASVGTPDPELALRRYRCMALQQSMRIERGSCEPLADASSPLVREVYLLLEADAADRELVRWLPGLAPTLASLRREVLDGHPPLNAFPPARRPLEELARRVLGGELIGTGSAAVAEGEPLATPADSLAEAERVVSAWLADAANMNIRITEVRHYRDWWSGELLPLDASGAVMSPGGRATDGDLSDKAARSARLPRRPKVRQPDDEDGDDDRQGAWMVQTAQPHERAEDPAGLQRPTDRDAETSPDEFADALSELPEARLVASPAVSREVLVSDDPPSARLKLPKNLGGRLQATYIYPEWDWRSQSYREQGAAVRVLEPVRGPRAWVEKTIREHQRLLDTICRRFELLRARRQRLRRQLEGEELDIEAWVDARADLLAGQPMSQALYESRRPLRRELAIVLLIDTSGSTDSWVAANRRIVDVEREALLLVCMALERLREPFSVLAFSGHGPAAVTVREVKGFAEPYGDEIAERVAGLDAEEYTRAGAAIRHATATLMREPAAHRLLLLLSDGRPNDLDEYDGRYGIEDTRQAVIEAQLQGVSPFCLAIDRQAAAWLPQVFGARQYARLTQPALLPGVLLEWMKRLVTN